MQTAGVKGLEPARPGRGRKVHGEGGVGLGKTATGSTRRAGSGTRTIGFPRARAHTPCNRSLPPPSPLTSITYISSSHHTKRSSFTPPTADDDPEHYSNHPTASATQPTGSSNDGGGGDDVLADGAAARVPGPRLERRDGVGQDDEGGPVAAGRRRDARGPARRPQVREQSRNPLLLELFSFSFGGASPPGLCSHSFVRWRQTKPFFRSLEANKAILSFVGGKQSLAKRMQGPAGTVLFVRFLQVSS
jgi:hypothetical protein